MAKVISQANTHARDYPPLYLILAISFVVPLAAGCIALINSFDGLYGQDAYAYFDYGVNSLREQLYPPPPFFWPPGYPLTIYSLSFALGSNPIGAQLVSMICGGFIVLGTGLITYEVWPDHRRNVMAIMAAVVMAVAGQLWQSSAVIMADTLSLGTATMGVWALGRYARLLEDRQDASFWLVLAAGLVGYATITRWIYGVLALICMIYAFTLFYRHRRIANRHGAFAALVALAILAPVLLPSFTADNTTYGGNFQLQFKTWNLANAFQREFFNSDGSFLFEQPNGLYYGSLPARSYYFTPFLALFALPGLFIAVREKILTHLFPVIGWTVMIYLLLVGLPQQNVRFALSYSPPIAVFSGIGIVAVWDLLAKFKQARILQAGLVLVVLAGVAWAVYTGINWTQDFIQRKEADLATVSWLEQQLPEDIEDAQLITFGLTLTIDHYTPLETHEIYYLEDTDIERIINADRPTYLMIDTFNVESQWRNKSPQLNYAHLREDPGLSEIGRYRAYTLFEVNQR